jgi:AbiV family abortive infection protein
MVSANELLLNAERLLSDAQSLFVGGRCRSAATLTVVALEQMGAFVEVLTLEKYPDAEVHMGIFGDRANSHAKRQDALAGHVFNYAQGEFAARVLAQAYFSEHGWTNPDGFMPWLLSRSKQNSVTLTDKQQQEQRECPDIATGHLLMHLTRTNRLKDLREYGLYEHVRQTFSDAEIGQIIELAAKVRAILAKSYVVPEPFKMAGVNMPDISSGP